MRVLLILKKFDFGGAENHVCDLANSLTKLGYEVFLIAGKGRQEARLNPKVTFIPYRLRDHFFFFNVYFIIRTIKRNKIDIIHAHQRISIFYSCIIRRLFKIPLVVTIHGRTRLDLKSRFTRNTPDRFIFVSNHVLQVSACYNQIKERSIVIPNGVEVIENNFERKPYSLCYVSRLDLKHSEVVLMMIRDVLPLLVKIYPDLTFYIIGEGKGLKDIQFEVEILNKSLSKQVCFVLGYQSEVKEIFLESSLVMGVGRVAIEALACGVRVLSINQKRLGTIISTKNLDFYKSNNFVAVESKPPSPNELFSILMEFFKNADEWKTDTKTIQNIIKQEFSIIEIAVTTANVYYEVLNEVVGI